MSAPNTVREILYHLLVFHEAQDEFFALTVGSWNTPIAKHIRKVQKNSVAARFFTTARCVTKMTKRVKFDALPARFVTPACLSTRGDKTCRKVHSLHVLSPFRQQLYNLSGLFPRCAHVCVCVCLSVCMRACVLRSVVLCFIIPA